MFPPFPLIFFTFFKIFPRAKWATLCPGHHDTACLPLGPWTALVGSCTGDRPSSASFTFALRSTILFPLHTDSTEESPLSGSGARSPGPGRTDIAAPLSIDQIGSRIVRASITTAYHQVSHL